MLDTSEDLAVCAQELGCPVERLLTPLTRYTLEPEGMFAIDNGCFASFEEKNFLSLLARERANRERCRFVSAPDVVGSARRTLELFRDWRHTLCGWPVALVAQDGQEGLDIPWHRLDAVFIGGSTEWKESRHAAAVIKAAKIWGKWVHVGRVNTPARFEHFEKLGADSIDGTGLARYTHMREKIAASFQKPPLFKEIQ